MQLIIFTMYPLCISSIEMHRGYIVKIINTTIVHFEIPAQSAIIIIIHMHMRQFSKNGRDML